MHGGPIFSQILPFFITPLGGAQREEGSKDALNWNFSLTEEELNSSSVQTCGTMKIYCRVKANAGTEGDNMLLNYSAIIYLQLIRLCCY